METMKIDSIPTGLNAIGKIESLLFLISSIIVYLLISYDTIFLNTSNNKYWNLLLIMSIITPLVFINYYLVKNIETYSMIIGAYCILASSLSMMYVMYNQFIYNGFIL
jgi:hypothetical protein